MSNLPPKFAANIIGVIGILICAVAGVGRLLGFYHLAGMQTITLFIGGISLMVLAVLVKLCRIEAMVSDKP